MNNPLLYTDPSGQVCIAGFDVFPWGDKCTDQDRARAVAAFQWWGGLLSSTNYQGGYIYEILYNLAVVPELAQQVVTFMMNNVPSFKTWAENSAAQAFLNCDPDIQQFLVWAKNYSGSPYFKLGQASGRITLLLLSGGAIVGSIGGGTAVAVTTAGFGLAVSPVAASVAAYGLTVATSVVVRELSDHLIMSAIGGNLGWGGSSARRQQILDKTNQDELTPGEIEQLEGMIEADVEAEGAAIVRRTVDTGAEGKYLNNGAGEPGWIIINPQGKGTLVHEWFHWDKMRQAGWPGPEVVPSAADEVFAYSWQLKHADALGATEWDIQLWQTMIEYYSR